MVPMNTEWTVLSAHHNQETNVTLLDLEKAHRCTTPLCLRHAVCVSCVGYWNREKIKLTTSHKLNFHIDGFAEVRKVTSNVIKHLQRREKGYRVMLHVQLLEN